MRYRALSLQDRIDIQDLFSWYGYLVDENREDEWVELFTEDGVFDAPGLGRWEGRERVREICQMVAAGSQGKWRHKLLNVVAEPGDTPDTARFRCNGLVTYWDQEPAAMTFNDYSGRLRKIDGDWKIVELVAVANKITV